jgi:nucleotide-binding universal stress UspA family protein
MIKTVFIPASGSDTDMRVFATALAIARPFDAHMRFLHIEVTPREAAARSPHVDFTPRGAIENALESLRENANSLSGKALQNYQEFCEARGIRMHGEPRSLEGVSASWAQETGAALNTLMLHVRHSDITVLGRPHNRDYMPMGLVQSILMGSGRPLVLAPEGAPPEAINTVVVGWKETPEAARALAASLPLLSRAERVVLLSIEEEGAASPKALEDLAAQLAWHGISAGIHVTDGRTGPARHHLQRTALQLQADLLVVGGFGHGPFREQMFGGVTQSLIDEALLPVLVMH